VKIFSSLSLRRGLRRRPDDGETVTLPFMPEELRVATMAAAVRELDRPMVNMRARDQSLRTEMRADGIRPRDAGVG